MHMKKNKNQLVLVFVVSLAIISMSFVNLSNTTEPWKAPATAKNIKNPLKGNTQATNEGKKLYANMCAICHGNKGKGDGVAGMTLNPRPANFTKSIVQDQTDGEIYWKITNGRLPMASYKDILTEEQRWQVVNYIRTFKK